MAAFVTTNRVEYEKALAAWKADTLSQITRYMGTVQGSKVVTFEMLYKYERLLAWGLVIPMPWQIGFSATSYNADAFVSNVDTFYLAMLANDISRAKPVQYQDPVATAYQEKPLLNLQSSLTKAKPFFQALTIAVIVCAGAMVVGGILGGSTAATSATGSVPTIAATPSVAVTPTAGAVAVPTLAPTATYTVASSPGLLGAIKTGGAWLLKTAAGAAASNKIGQEFAEKQAEKQAEAQQTLALAQAAQQAKDLKEIEAMQAEIDAAKAGAEAKPLWQNPLAISIAVLAAKLIFF